MLSWIVSLWTGPGVFLEREVEPREAGSDHYAIHSKKLQHLRILECQLRTQRRGSNLCGGPFVL